MAHETELAELTKVPEAIRRLQASSRRALPITLIGLAATLIAAGISTYYAFYLSGQLDKARSELTATKLQLESTRAELNAAGASLLQVQKYAAPSQQIEVRAALESVARGERKLSAASATLAQAASRLPTTSAEAKPDPALPAPP
ncbi:MAG TPA: hypothetical protein VJU34_13755, partial [Phenylobacterium sp.]|nr:hypothetical protein [Phenylobacterium sp.]